LFVTTKTKRDAREEARARMAAQRRAEARRAYQIRAGIAVLVVLAVVGIIVGVYFSRDTAKPAAGRAPASAELVAAVTGVPAATLDKVGKGKVDALPKSTSGESVRMVDGKPLVFFMGAEFCPYCAAERWPLIVALSRFGTFSNLSTTSSSSTDTDPNTPTFSFHGSSFTSKYITFQPVEVETNQPTSGGGYTALDKLTSDQQAIVDKFDSGGGFPFVDFGDQAIGTASIYDPALLAGKTQDQVATQLTDPNSDIAKAILGSANAYTAQICKLTNNQPSDVCSSTAATAFNGG
jgi:thiol-disulfide isomerase/thioredoxin